MSLAAGTRVGPYEIVSMIGAGGMGEVYRARDTRLDRIVAVKALPADKLADEGRKRRFLVEARAASALNHPNIVGIHDLATANGAEFLVMEFVPGQTLESAIPKRGLRLNETLRYAIQIADALAAAHEAGILHRDVKPGNIMVTPTGGVKLLDFGLAKLMERDAWRSDATTGIATLEGTIAGTMSYMSPEQAEAKPLDDRSDIFSFGCVVYEMLTGHRAFQGDSAMSTLNAVLTSEPKAVAQLVPGVPRDLERVINRCLRKDPERRFQTARDLRVALQELLDESGSGIPAHLAPVSKRDPRLWLRGALGLSVTVAVAVWLSTGRREQPSAAMVESQLTAYEGREWQPSFSSDGNQVAFVWSRDGSVNSGDIFVRLIGAGQPVQLTNTPEREFSPAWSPDGRWIAFLRYASRNATTSLFVMPSIGGGERKVIETLIVGEVRGYPELMVATVRWSPDGKWLLVSGTVEKDETVGLLLIDFATGDRRRLTRAPAEAWDVGGSFSPDGRRIGFLRQRSGNLQGDIHLLDVDANFRAAGESQPLTTDGLQMGPPVWTADGREVVFQSTRGGRSDLWRASVSGGTPVRVLVAGTTPGEPAIRGSRLAYVQQVSNTNIWAIPTSGAGDAVRLVASTLNEFTPQYSPDGSRLAFCSDQSGSSEIWVALSDGSRQEKLTSFGFGHSCTPRWSPDSRSIVFDSSAEAAQFEIYVISADGGRPRRLTEHPGTDALASFSRDGRWIYFTSNRTGRYELWKMPAAGGQAFQVTTNGGYVAFESVDSQTLYFTKEQGGALWKMAPGRGEESKVLDQVAARNFIPTRDGIYFMRRNDQVHAVQFLDFATGQVQSLRSMTISDALPYAADTSNGLTVSSDGRWLAYVQQDHSGSDIVLVDNFR